MEVAHARTEAVVYFQAAIIYISASAAKINLIRIPHTARPLMGFSPSPPPPKPFYFFISGARLSRPWIFFSERNNKGPEQCVCCFWLFVYCTIQADK